MSTRNLWLALAMAAMTMTACGGEPVDENDEQGAVDQNGKADSTKRPKVCGGIANLKCAKGYTCEITSKDPDATGKCIPSPAQTCDDLTCAAGTHCEMKGINGASIPVCLND